MRINREEMIEQLEWNSGGTGNGICAVANSFLWSTSRPKHPRGDDDLKSIVAISGPPDIRTKRSKSWWRSVNAEQKTTIAGTAGVWVLT